ncbi:MAG: Loki-CTERM sorting domain-containing protein [Promethearchaeota archaeon]|jgi:hypothetical protein
MKKISVSLAILVVILMLGVFVSLPLVKVNDLTHPVEDLKLSDGEITIVTPENKTYMGPMSGYYPATWGFENTFEGDDPLGWGVDESAGPIQVLDDYGNRKKVVEIEDNSGSADSNIQLNIADQENGTVEVWLRNTDADEYCQLILAQDNGLTHAQRVTTRIYNWRVSTSGWTDLTPAEDNIWYHVRIDFECGNNGYQGLPGNHCNVYINEVKFGPYVFENNVSAIDSIMISTSTFSFGRKIYADALGYSWDPDYSVGDNLNEGLLLSYENTTTLDWKGYSLDGVSNRTVLGNTTVPIPDNGLHNIQLYANNSIGTRFQSDLRYFTIDTSPYIDIITPENKTYTTPDSGYFPATYGFEDTMDGQDPLEWFDVDTQKGSIISEIDGHKKVYEAVDNSGSTGSSIFNYFDVQSYGTVEFWCRFSSASEGHFYNLRKVVNPGGPHISIIYDGFWFSNSTGSYEIENAPSPQINNWYHIRLDFRGSFLSNYQGLTDQYTYFIYIDDEQFGPYGYQVNEDLDGFVAHTGAVSSGFSIWWDSVGYSWDPNYNIGDNLNEGLLLSYENITTLDWKGYSLDGATNKSIMGNITIPLPADGLHSIQVFGNDSMGNMYESQVNYFSVHHINLITPEAKVYTEAMNGYYPGTYGFENDNPYQHPQEWSIYEGGGTLEVVPEIYNHKKVIKIYRNSAPGEWVYLSSQTMTPQTHGTIEYWVLIEDISKFMGVRLTGGGLDILFFGIRRSKWQYATGVWNTLQNIPDPINNTWYHVKIQFECSTGNYMSLGQYKLEIVVDGVSSGEIPFQNDQSSADYFDLRSGQSEYDYNGYLDSVGFSWNSGYDIGDNMNEGLLVGYENSTTLDWQGYSLNGQTNKPILGNLTIPMPSDGVYTIQVFGNDSVGTMYESTLQQFTVDRTPPQILITYPTAAQEFSDAPAYILSITEENIETIWYTLNGGTIHPITSESGTIDSSAWNALANGPVTIRFYVRDVADREAFDEIIIVKVDSNVPAPPGIPGYNIIALIGVSGVVALVLLRKRKPRN